MLKKGGIDVEGKVFVAKNAHIIKEKHLWSDSGETAIGTTRTGNGPCYSSKYSRSGLRAQDDERLQPQLIDLYEEFYYRNPDAIVLKEHRALVSTLIGVTILMLPVVTALQQVILNGFPPQSLRKVYGVARLTKHM